LQRRESSQPIRIADAQGFGQARGIVVAGTDGPHFPGTNELFEGSQRFFERRGWIILVRLVQVDAVGAQPAQRRARA
jgi:hypothetical protein